MSKDVGRVPSAPGSREPSPDGLGPSGFDPSRVEWPLCGYAPGSYMGRCLDCGETFHDLDKRATQCLACAVRGAKTGLAALQIAQAERAAYRTQAINRGWNWRMCEAYGRENYQRHLEREIDATLEVMLGRKTLIESLRDSDGSPEGGASEAGSMRSTTARAEGIAQTPVGDPS